MVGGLVGATDFTTTYGGSGLGVTTSTGEAIVPGSSSTTQSGYYVRGSSATTNSPASANPSLPRIDLIYLQINDAAYTGVTNSGTCSIATGTPASGASLSNLSGAPSLPTSSLALAYVLVPAAATSISNSDILNVATSVRFGLSTSARLVASLQTIVGGSNPSGLSFALQTGATVPNGSNIVSGGDGVQGFFSFAPSDWSSASSPELTLLLTTYTNTTSPATTLTGSVATGLTFAGTSGQLTLTASGTTGGITVTPIASSIVGARSTFSFLASQNYCLGFSTGGTTASASVIGVTMQLWAN